MRRPDRHRVDIESSAWVQAPAHLCLDDIAENMIATRRAALRGALPSNCTRLCAPLSPPC
jgi:hypothetical protein